MRCYEVVHVHENQTGPLLELTRRAMPDLGSPSDRLANGLRLPMETGR